ncbi:hypothetical protein A6F57_02720 [Alteromonas stellipolaris]|uniref:hypothetical protein n=1 Tax=Alteromonas stellipolaris TaxID=233316 RepID=UPI0007B4558C|nr:hypothetical protein [Alteromonas stellipolaris]ANB24222.1 hypothetical protein A6F57_02720 [Alteromonas stellipolaris]
MNQQIILEATMIGTMFLVTAGYFLRSKESASNKAKNFVTALLGGFMVMGGTAKFFLPFADIFAAQIELSGLPFPALSKFAGQMGEILAGSLYLLVLTEGKLISSKVASVIFNIATLLTVVIMSVAVYVHLSPNVPAEVLPFQSKPPVLTLIVMFVALGLWLSKKKV